MVVDSRTAKSAKAKRFLRNREPKLNENPKTALLVRGQKTSGLINNVLVDLFMLKKPHGSCPARPRAGARVPHASTHFRHCRHRRAPQAAQCGAPV